MTELRFTSRTVRHSDYHRGLAKVCRVCMVERALSDFYHSIMRGQLRPASLCKRCDIARSAAWRTRVGYKRPSRKVEDLSTEQLAKARASSRARGREYRSKLENRRRKKLYDYRRDKSKPRCVCRMWKSITRAGYDVRFDVHGFNSYALRHRGLARIMAKWQSEDYSPYLTPVVMPSNQRNYLRGGFVFHRPKDLTFVTRERFEPFRGARTSKSLYARHKKKQDIL